jgi:hypothetical protein
MTRPGAMVAGCRRLTVSRRGVNDAAMAGAGVVCVLVGVIFVVVSIRRHPGSEADGLIGSSRAFARLMGIGTGGWLIAVAGAMFSHDRHALLGILVAFPVLYIVVAGVLMVTALGGLGQVGGFGQFGGAHRREPGLRPEKPPPRPPDSIYHP